MEYIPFANPLVEAFISAEGVYLESIGYENDTVDNLMDRWRNRGNTARLQGNLEAEAFCRQAYNFARQLKGLS